MSYGELYNITFTNRLGVSCELEIEQKDYAGASSYVKCAGNPMTIEWDTPSDFLLEPINGSKLTFRLIAETDFQFLELYTSNNREYRITYKEAGSVSWRGFHLPDQYREDYKQPPYTCEFIAADQLGYLRELTWTNTSTLSEIEALEIILAATGLEFDLQEGINVYATGHNSTSADSPLDQTYFDTNVFKDKTYYDALYNILFKYQAILKQRNGEWFIYRPREATAAYNLRKWTYSMGIYTYDSVQSYDPVVLTTSAPPDTALASMVRIAAGAGMFIKPAWKSYVLKHELGLKEAFNPNYDFTNIIGTTAISWTKAPSTITMKAGNALRVFSQSAFSSAIKIYNFSPLEPIGDDEQCMEFNIDFNVGIPAGKTTSIYLAVELDGVGQSFWYDPDDGTWNTNTKYIIQDFSNSSGIFSVNGQSIKILTDEWSSLIPLTDVVGVYIHIYAPECIGSNAAYIEVDTASLKMMRLVDNSSADSGLREIEPFVSEHDYSDDIDLNNNYVPEEMEVLLGDLGDDFHTNVDRNGKHIWTGGLYLNDALTNETYEWTADDRTAILMELMKANFVDLFQYPQQVITCTIFSKLIDPCTIIQEINNTTAANKFFMIKRASYHPKFNQWEMEAYQLVFRYAEQEEYLVSEGDVGEEPITSEGDVGESNIIRE